MKRKSIKKSIKKQLRKTAGILTVTLSLIAAAHPLSVSAAKASDASDNNNSLSEEQKAAFCAAVSQLENQYGICGQGMIPNMKYLTGLCYLALTDLDENGDKELFAAFCSKEPDDSDYLPTYRYQLFTCKDGSAVTIGEGDVFYSNGGWGAVCWTKFDNKTYLVSNASDFESPSFFSIDDTGKLLALHSSILQYPSDGGSPLGYIDGQLVSEDEWNAATDKRMESAVYMNFCCGSDEELLTERVDNVKETLGYTNPSPQPQSISPLRQQAIADVEAAAQKAAELDNILSTQALSQSEMNQYSYEMYMTWDDALNLLWGYLKQSLPSESMDSLTSEEIDWIYDKEAQITAAGAEWEGGSMQPMAESLTGAELTKERVYVLLDKIP